MLAVLTAFSAFIVYAVAALIAAGACVWVAERSGADTETALMIGGLVFLLLIGGMAMSH